MQTEVEERDALMSYVPLDILVDEQKRRDFVQYWKSEAQKHGFDGRPFFAKRDVADLLVKDRKVIYVFGVERAKPIPDSLVPHGNNPHPLAGAMRAGFKSSYDICGESIAGGTRICIKEKGHA